MYDSNRILALIPARGGSKGLPEKNIKRFFGKQLIAWTIDEAKKSKYIDKIVVSTENKEIAIISKKLGAEIPFIRPAELATDSAKGIDVAIHTMEWFEKNNEKFDYLILLQPTSPLRIVEDIDVALEFLFQNNYKSVASVCLTDHHPWWSNTLPDDLNMKNFIRNEIKNISRQELPLFYRINGAVYAARWDYIKRIKGFIGDETYAYIMPVERSIDIDTEIDFITAETIVKKKYQK